MRERESEFDFLNIRSKKKKKKEKKRRLDCAPTPFEKKKKSMAEYGDNSSSSRSRTATTMTNWSQDSFSSSNASVSDMSTGPNKSPRLLRHNNNNNTGSSSSSNKSGSTSVPSSSPAKRPKAELSGLYGVRAPSKAARPKKEKKERRDKDQKRQALKIRSSKRSKKHLTLDSSEGAKALRREGFEFACKLGDLKFSDLKFSDDVAPPKCRSLIPGAPKLGANNGAGVSARAPATCSVAVHEAKVLGTTVALFKVKSTSTKGRSRVFAVENRCSHAGVSLSSGDIEDIDDAPCIKCPGHGIAFDLSTGAQRHPKGTRRQYRQQIFQVKRLGDQVWVRRQ
jgi:nitrite reductase/ring-hydroxylating ferredoxin subunit